MACFHPLAAWQTGNKFHWEPGHGGKFLFLPCGKCIGCRTTRAQAWAQRCLHEAKMHDASVFVTLTYNELHTDISLRPNDLKQFIRRYVKELGPTRYFAIGEYGDQNYRPHYHALLFGHPLDDAGPVSDTARRSKTLERLWPNGYSSWGQVTMQSAAYCARYALKKINGEKAEAHYTRLDATTGELVRVQPEFARMSLKPGIGKTWFDKYWQSVYLPRDGVLQPGGRVTPAPRAYDKWLEAQNPLLREEKRKDREKRSREFAKDTTPDRLRVRETCAKAKQQFLKRHL